MFRFTEAVEVCGAEFGPLATVRRLPSCSTADTAPLDVGIFGAFSVIGGGRFFKPGAAPATVGAVRMAIGSGSLGAAGADAFSATCSCRALKFLFFRMGVAMAKTKDTSRSGDELPG